MLRRTFIRKTGTAGLIGFITPHEILPRVNQDTDISLEQGFQTPAASAYPQVFWFWMNGNISREGITKDLEAMKEVGIGGVFNFDVGTGVPKGPVAYLSTEWLGLKKFAMQEAERLGLEFTMHNCPGWSASGGPWITPELSMQEITWSEVYVSGGKQVIMNLPKPPNRFNYYNDLVVLAFPSLEGEALLQTVEITSGEDAVDIKKITGEDPQGVIVRLDESTQSARLQFEFEEPFEAQTLTFFIAAENIEGRQPVLREFSERTSIDLETSDDGLQFRLVTSINTGVEADLLSGDKFIVYDIPVTKAKYFRLSSSKTRIYKQVRFSGITRLQNWMEKTNSRATTIVYVDKASGMFEHDQRKISSTSIIDVNAVLDLSEHVDENTVLTWEAPAGDWTIMRIDFTSNGRMIRSAPDGGAGLECDKFNASAMDLHFNNVIQNFLSSIGSLSAKGKMGLEIDSYEAGAQNWTHGFEKEFEKRWKYDLLKYLPAVAGGHIVGGMDLTERFLWDFRTLQADLIASNYYGRFHELCQQHGITSYAEPYDQGPMEEMQIGSKVDVSMGEFWNGISTTFPYKSPVRRTLRLAASIAHTNNKKIIGAESFTAEPDSSRWAEYPFALKAVGDKAFVKGVNKMIIHRFAHQPNSSALPGMTMGPWGIHFERTNTWWTQSKPWLGYLSRCQSLLQQGDVVADLLYFTGEEANIFTRVEPDELTPTPPEGYNYDLANAETILNRIKIVNNQVLLNDQLLYRVLIFQNYQALTLELLLKIQELVKDGMILVGAKPQALLGLSNYSNNEEFHRITDELWGNIDGNATTEHKFGKGRVFWGTSLEIILQHLNIKPDFELSSHSGDAPLIFTHRRVGNTEIYFLSNQRRSFEDTVCTFRVKNKQPELWDANAGKITPAGIYELTDDRVRMPVQFEPYGSAFVVFRSSSTLHFHSLKKDNQTIIGTQPFHRSSRKLYKEIADNFSISFWAKPEINILLYPDIVPGSIGLPSTDYYAIYPSPGKELYGEGHATCGLTVGRNGIAVWEHSDIPVLILAAETAISGWSHVTLIYKDKVPSVYVNGKFIGNGKKSNYTVHPDVGEAYLNEGASYYNGDMSEAILFDEILSGEKIPQLVAQQPSFLQSTPFVAEIVGDKKPALLIRQNGNYSLYSSTAKVTSLRISNIDEPFVIEGPWNVSFPANLGAPSQITLPKLISLHLHADDGVKYFSGTVTYTNSFSFAQATQGTEKIFLLDLGRVEVIAEVNMNGKALGTFWKRPYRIHVTSALQEGMNKLEILVTNLWPNRLIGDEQMPDPDKFTPGAGSSGSLSVTGGAIEQLPAWYMEGKPKPADGRIRFATWKHYNKDSPLLESGLIGPMILHTAILKYL